MYKTKQILCILLISMGLILCIWASKSFSDDPAEPYSGKSDATISAWYDETYQASGFYRLQRIGASNNFRYEYTTTPTTSSNPTFVEEGSAETKETQPEPGPGPGHTHNYTDATSGASLPQDIIVTEWKVSGHVHFASSGM